MEYPAGILRGWGGSAQDIRLRFLNKGNVEARRRGAFDEWKAGFQPPVNSRGTGCAGRVER
eukprot:scaffold4292_cov101-Isochrysis_galbana.AAC.2